MNKSSTRVGKVAEEEGPELSLTHGHTSSYLHITNSENDLKTDRTDLSQLILRRKIYCRGKEGWSLVRNQSSGGNNHKQKRHHEQGEARGSDPMPGTHGIRDLHWEDEPTEHLALKTSET